MHFEYARELDEVNRKLKELREQKTILIRRFVLANKDKPIGLFYKRLALHGGLPAAIRWYMVAYDVGILRAKKEINLICKKPLIH